MTKNRYPPVAQPSCRASCPSFSWGSTVAAAAAAVVDVFVTSGSWFVSRFPCRCWTAVGLHRVQPFDYVQGAGSLSKTCWPTLSAHETVRRVIRASSSVLPSGDFYSHALSLAFAPKLAFLFFTPARVWPRSEASFPTSTAKNTTFLHRGTA